jgi:DNA-binding LacI/PurR family transcriptional regulator
MAKRATAREVAERAGVSRTTVSFVLNRVPGIRISDETRRLVLAAARELNYHPDANARRMVSGRTHIIGFVLRQSLDQAFADRFVPAVLSGVSAAAAELGYKVLFEPLPPDDHTSSYAHLIRERHVDGIVLSGPRLDDQELLRIYLEGAHVVLIGQLPETDLPFVDVNNRGGAAQATRHLLKLGHKRIALITNAGPIYTASADRLAGYRQTLEEAGIAYDPALVRYGNFTPESGAAEMKALLGLPKPPNAVFVASDTVALGAMQTMRRMGVRVPEDMALVGFDDIPLSEFLDPPLTTVRLPAYGLGWGAADLLTRMLAGEEVRSPCILLETELIVRESCGASLQAGAAQTP